MKKHAEKVLVDVKLDDFARAIRNLQIRYQNEHKNNSSLTVELFILKNKTLTRKKLQESIARYHKKPRQQTTTEIVPINVSWSPIQAKGNNENFASDNN